MSDVPQPYFRETVWSQWIAEELGARSEQATLFRSRCDIVTLKYAIEVEWSSKWKEAIGQAGLYSVALARKPAVLLLVNDREKEQLNIGRCAAVCGKFDILFTWIDCHNPEDKIPELFDTLN